MNLCKMFEFGVVLFRPAARQFDQNETLFRRFTELSTTNKRLIVNNISPEPHMEKNFCFKLPDCNPR